jgi:hypothetical protein
MPRRGTTGHENPPLSRALRDFASEYGPQDAVNEVNRIGVVLTMRPDSKGETHLPPRIPQYANRGFSVVSKGYLHRATRAATIPKFRSRFTKKISRYDKKIRIISIEIQPIFFMQMCSPETTFERWVLRDNQYFGDSD